jgi:WD40 repeat protein
LNNSATAAPFRYRAFLSYSHSDMRWAKWLHARLESFQIDKDLIGVKTALGVVPETLRPIFRDRGDFSGGQSLTEATISALDASAALVVICSTSSAKRPLVNEEVRLFRSRHPCRPVIPIIIDGSPPENFPPALRWELETDGSVSNRPITILAPDVRETGDGKNLALAKVIAAILGLPTDEIFRRAERERRRKAGLRATILTAFVILFMTSLAAGGWAYIAELRSSFARSNALERQARRLMDQGDFAASASILLESLLDADGKVLPEFRNRSIMRTLHEAYLALPSSVELKGHKQAVTNVALSKDGSRIVTSSLDGSARIWNGSDGKEIGVFEYHDAATTDVAFSPTSDLLAVSSDDGSISLWDTSRKSLVGTLVGHKQAVKAISFNPTGTYLASIASDYSVKIWNVETKLPILSVQAESSFLSHAFAVSWNAAGNRLLTMGAQVQLWNVEALNSADDNSITEVKAKNLEVILDPHDASFSSDGSKVIVAGFTLGPLVVDSSTGGDVATPFGPSSPAIAAAFQPAGALLAIGYYDGSTWVQTLDRNKPANILGGHEGPIWKVRFNHEGSRFATASFDGSVIVYSNSLTNDGMRPRVVLRGHKAGVYDFAFSRDGGMVVTIAIGETVAVLWSLNSANDNFFLREAKLAEFDSTFEDSNGDFLAPGREQKCVKDVGSCEISSLEQRFERQFQEMFRSIRGSDFLIDYLVSAIPSCLGLAMRASLNLDREPPYWCIEKEKAPYNTEKWKSWLKAKREGLQPEIPTFSQ